MFHSIILREMGIVTDADIVGGMGWRFRIRKAKRENLSAKEPAKGSCSSSAESAVIETKTNDSEPRMDINVVQKTEAPVERHETKPELTFTIDAAPIRHENLRIPFETDATLTESQRKYLQVIADIEERAGQVHSTDIVAELGRSKASVSKAVSRLESPRNLTKG